MQNLITKNDCSLEFAGIGRRAFVNSLSGRLDLERDCAHYHCQELFAEVLKIWGDEPTISGPEKVHKTFNDLKSEKRAEVAAARYVKETGGFDFNGVKIATDRGSQALLTAAVVTARFDPEFKTKWKCDDGRFVTLDAMQLRAIGDAVTAFIESCFAHEAELCALVDAAQNAEELGAIDISFE